MKRKKTKRSQEKVMNNTIAHHLLINSQPVPKEKSEPTSPSLYTGH